MVKIFSEKELSLGDGGGSFFLLKKKKNVGNFVCSWRGGREVVYLKRKRL